MKFFKKSLSILLALVMTFAFMSLAFAANEVTVSVDVEGISKTLFNGDVKIAEGANAVDVLKATGLDVVVTQSQYGSYVSSIAGEAAATFTYNDGWGYDVNGETASVGMDQYKAVAGDKLTYYYYDWQNFQKPIVKFSDDYSTVTITSKDTTYDPVTYEPTTSENPVKGATVNIDGTKVVTDDNGKAEIPSNLRAGTHSYTIEKYAENGLPVVLRTNGSYEAGSSDSGSGNAFMDFLAKIVNWFKALFQKIVGIFKK